MIKKLRLLFGILFEIIYLKFEYGTFKVQKWLGVIKSTFGKFLDDRGMKLSASLAYYTVFSLPALLIL